MKKSLKEFLCFGVVGVLNTILSIIIYWTCLLLGMHYLIGNAVGFIITVAISYILNNIFTFRNSEEKIIWSLLILLKVYASYFLSGIVINSVLLWFWNDVVNINEKISPLLNLIITVPLNFFINKVWIYRKTRGDRD